jgi:hypothetical protein
MRLIALALAVFGSSFTAQTAVTITPQVPDNYVELQRVNRAADTFVFTRRKFAAEFAIWERRGERLERVSLTGRQQGSLYFLHALVSGGAVYVIAYNTADTSPSGRSHADYRDGIDLYRLDRDAEGRTHLREVRRMLAVGGIDSVFYDAPIRGGMASCAERGCILFDRATPRVITPSAWSRRELIEIAGDGTRAFGLFQLAPDDRFDTLPTGKAPVHFVCSIAINSACEPLPPKVPAELSIVDGRWRVRYAENRDGRIAVLMRDLERSPEQRQIFDVNYEGRITWSQVYVLEGLIDILSSREPFPPALVAHAQERLSAELDGIAALGRIEPWFWVKRYSLARQPIASIVHLGRISSLVDRALLLPEIGDYSRLSETLIAELTSLEQTMEERKGASFAIKRGVPFWLDGGNVPWNFQSAWIEAMARHGQSRDAVAGMVRLMIEQERLARLPVTWRYMWGSAHDGWTPADNVSTNTPDWEGNKTLDAGGLAHISYRTMDARALLAAHRFLAVPLPPGFIDQLQRLVQRGRLTPSLSPDLIALGRRPQLDDAIARMYSRAGRPIQIQNQFWALILEAR